MKNAPFTFLFVLAAAGGFFQVLAEGPPSYTHIRLTPWFLEMPGPPVKRAAAVKGLRQPRLAGAARVEVWGDTLEERLRLFRMDLTPSLSRAYVLGTNSSATSQQLGEFMTMTASDVRPPSVPSVFYNGFRRVDDPELARAGIHIGVNSRSTITISAEPRRR
ncbi:hypothetical protein [Mesoterricola silvestris]|uniref:Uncharacterized protein n=1 Tax=Mesoterricola silvestris TaxID=2927979 RepID=A0AA48GZU9_9BACT|nr:hypothetical protein [Mesoterricola silvestris]BDU73423.1 hypothetical protein METEAL_25970 [Mesoterricola silvestris]